MRNATVKKIICFSITDHISSDIHSNITPPSDTMNETDIPHETFYPVSIVLLYCNAFSTNDRANSGLEG